MPTVTPKRGARPSPQSVVAATPKHAPKLGAPPNAITIPARLSMWGNDVHGDCVTAEEAFAKACHNPEIFVPDEVVIGWASAHGALEGAVISDVLHKMQDDGFRTDGNQYDDGPYATVDWRSASILHSAIAIGPVKLGIAADQIENAWRSTSGRSGWFATGFHADSNEDHCVALCGYGSISWLAQQLHVPVPSGIDGTKPAYALYTWNSIGIIDEPSMVAITHEAWLRNPTTVIKKPFTGKVTLTDTSPLSPALASLNNTLYIAWKGDGNDNLNVMGSHDGQTFAGKYTSPERSPCAPALCAHNGILFVAWKGDGNNNLNVARVEMAGPNIAGFSSKVTLGDTSSHGPALASFNGHLFLAWKGDGNNNLNLMYSADNGATFAHKYTSPETSVQAPCLAAASGNLFIGWKGDGNNNLNVARVHMAGPNITNFGDKNTLPDTSPVSPALAGTPSNLFLGWKGDGNDSLNVENSTNGAVSFNGKQTSSETSPQSPALAVMGGKLYIAWKGDGNDNLNVMRFGS
jgi:hypothetical protein